MEQNRNLYRKQTKETLRIRKENVQHRSTQDNINQQGQQRQKNLPKRIHKKSTSTQHKSRKTINNIQR